MARGTVRGVDPVWIRDIYSVALKPDAVFYLRLGVEQLIPRVIFSRGFDYWESGVDIFPGLDMYESFCNYQKALLAEFDRLSTQYGFEAVDASADAKIVFAQLQERILTVLDSEFLRPRPAESVAESKTAVRVTPRHESFERSLPRPEGVDDFTFRPFVPSLRALRHTNGNGHAT